ncbi:MAG: hypothetical protein ACL7BU_08770 [Candidatus Phlomobacter fragariae]
MAGDTAIISPFILVSDASSMDIFLRPITIKYNPIATTCDFSNKGLIVNLPMVSINGVKNIDRPGYQPFTLNFSCSDLLVSNKMTRNIAMFLASIQIKRC